MGPLHAPGRGKRGGQANGPASFEGTRPPHGLNYAAVLGTCRVNSTASRRPSPGAFASWPNATPLPKLTEEVETLAARVDEHLKKMGAVWK